MVWLIWNEQQGNPLILTLKSEINDFLKNLEKYSIKINIKLSCLGSWFSLRNSLVSKSIFSSSGYFCFMCHSSCTFSPSLNNFFRPIVFSNLLIGKTTTWTSLILNMISLLSTSSTLFMYLSMSLTKALSSFSFDH